MIAGPEGTPFSDGVFQLTLQIPSGYPAAAPTAAFRTKIFHPNVDEKTGAVCVDTLKRDWTPETKLRDVLVVIGCLLVSPNPASALNAEAGRLCESDYTAYEKRAATWVKIHARIPVHLKGAVIEARRRGEEKGEAEVEGNVNTLRRGRGKRRLFGAPEDVENDGRESKRRSRSGSSHAIRGIAPLATAPENALGITDVEPAAQAIVEETMPGTPRLSQGPSTQVRTLQKTPKQLSQQAALMSQYEYPTFTTLNTTFDVAPDRHTGTTAMQWDAAPYANDFDTPRRRAERQDSETSRMMAAGGNIWRYNTGTFGVRTGLFRL